MAVLVMVVVVVVCVVCFVGGWALAWKPAT